MFVDSHCHLNFPELLQDLDSYVLAMQEHQVDYALCIGTLPSNLENVVGIANQYENIFATVGVHPDEVLDGDGFGRQLLDQYLSNPKVVGIGETGLDYYGDGGPSLSVQHDRFRLHITVAKDAGLPLVIHTRNSIDDTIGILRECNVGNSGAVMHCFTESIENARKCVDLGFYISISGIVTFKNATLVREMAKFVPNDRLLIETDSPFLAPAPFRGKLNHPALVRYTAQCLADIRGVSVEQLGEMTTNNFFNLFKKAQLFLDVK